MNIQAEAAVPYELANAPQSHQSDALTARNNGFVAIGKKMRIVFNTGRDLNVFNVQSFNVDGQWWRITDGEGRFFVVDPAKVNYTETK